MFILAFGVLLLLGPFAVTRAAQRDAVRGVQCTLRTLLAWYDVVDLIGRSFAIEAEREQHENVLAASSPSR